MLDVFYELVIIPPETKVVQVFVCPSTSVHATLLPYIAMKKFLLDTKVAHDLKMGHGLDSSYH